MKGNIGKSNKLVVKVDPKLKKSLYIEMMKEDLTLQQWITDKIEEYLQEHITNKSKNSIKFDFIPSEAITFYDCNIDSLPLVYKNPEKTLVQAFKDKPFRYFIPMFPITGQVLLDIARIIKKLESEEKNIKCMFIIQENKETPEIGFAII
jgi:hypothetical protein